MRVPAALPTGLGALIAALLAAPHGAAGVVRCESIDLGGNATCVTQCVNVMDPPPAVTGVFYNDESVGSANFSSEDVCAPTFVVNNAAIFVCTEEDGQATLNGQICVSTATAQPPVADDGGTDAGMIVLVILIICIVVAVLAAVGRRQYNRRDGPEAHLGSPLFGRVKDIDRAAEGKAAEYYSQRSQMKPPPPSFGAPAQRQANYADDII